MKALYVRRDQTSGDDLADAGRVAGWGDGDSVRVFSGDSTLMCFPFRSDQTGHLLHPNPPGVFEAVFHHQSLPLFDTAWGRAHLRQLHRSLAPGGSVTVGYAEDRAAAAKGYWSLPALESFFGQKANVHEAERYATFLRNDELPAVPSVLRWYYEDCAKLVVEDMLIRPALRGASPDEVRGLLGDLPGPDAWPELTFRGTGPVAGESSSVTVARKHSYWVGGLAAKSAVMRRIIHDRFGRTGELRLLDHGGGLGLLAVEMLLEPDVPVTRAVNCDINSVNLVMSRHLHRFYHDQLSGRFHAHLGAAEKYPYPDPCDVISFVGSLLYVPRESTPGALAAAWDALRPGGILLVHENLKSDGYRKSSDYDVMFSRGELDTLLGRFGAISHYASTVAAPLKPEQVGEKTVFRVVTKAG